MSHFAKVENGIVTQVIVAEQDFIDSGVVGDPNTWIQTSYNTVSGIHILGGLPLRKNYAGIGFLYDEKLDAFIPPKPFDSWLLNEEKGNWEPPTPYPTDGQSYIWNEITKLWDINNIK